VAVGVGVGLGVGVAVGVATFTAIFTPLLHTSFFPDLMHVYLNPEEVLVCPCFAHLLPGFTAAVATGVNNDSTRALITKSGTFLRIEQLCGTKIKYF